MATPLRFPLLLELGLTETEARLYELLLEKGPSRASDLVEPSKLGRGNVYNILQQLAEKQLVFLKEGKFQIYEAKDPSTLRNLLESKQEATRRLEQAFLTTLPQLTSAYTLSTGKPAIQMFEGLAGMENALFDSLEAKDEILTYLDPQGLNAEFTELNKRYIRKRIQKEIKKRILLPDTKVGQSYLTQMKNDWTEIRLCKGMSEPFLNAIEIYNDKVAFHTLDPQKPVSFIIENARVTQFHRLQFEALWSLSA